MLLNHITIPHSLEYTRVIENDCLFNLVEIDGLPHLTKFDLIAKKMIWVCNKTAYNFEKLGNKYVATEQNSMMSYEVNPSNGTIVSDLGYALYLRGNFSEDYKLYVCGGYYNQQKGVLVIQVENLSVVYFWPFSDTRKVMKHLLSSQMYLHRASGGTAISCHYLSNGDEVWQFDIKEKNKYFVKSENEWQYGKIEILQIINNVVVIISSCYICGLDTQTGRIIWEHRMPEYGRTDVVSNGKLYALYNVQNIYRRYFIIDLSTGNFDAELEGFGDEMYKYFVFIPFVYRQFLVLAENDSNMVFIVDLQTAKVLYSFATDRCNYANMVVSENRILLLSSSENLYVYEVDFDALKPLL